VAIEVLLSLFQENPVPHRRNSPEVTNPTLRLKTSSGKLKGLRRDFRF